jgi:hypothetical protein
LENSTDGQRRCFPRPPENDDRHGDPTGGVGTRTAWDEIEASLAPPFAHKERIGRLVEDADMFGLAMMHDAHAPRMISDLARLQSDWNIVSALQH